MSITGKFVWHELATKDPDAALKFYSELFGWTYKTGEMGPSKYHEIMVDGRPIGGVMEAMGPQPVAWTAYVGVDNLEASVERAQRCGGKTIVPPMDIPGTGRFAIVSDPAGGVIAPFVYTMAEPDKPDTQGVTGTFAWNELLTDDVHAAKRFYGEVFGWTTQAMDMGPMGTYYLLRAGDKDVGGMMKRPKEMPVSAWLYYINTPDVDATNAKALKLGATQVTEPMDIPNVGRFSMFADPQGAVTCLFKGNPK